LQGFCTANFRRQGKRDIHGIRCRRTVAPAGLDGRVQDTRGAPRSMKRIAVVPGDGIGIDVTREAMRVLRRVNEVFSAGLEFTEFDWGAEKYLREGISLPAGVFEMLRRDFDAILFGAIGDPRVPDNKHAAEILLSLRFGLDLYA